MKSLNAIVEQILAEVASLPAIINPGAVEYVFDKKISPKMKKELDNAVWKTIEQQTQIDVEKVTHGKNSVIIEPMAHKPMPTQKQITAFGNELERGLLTYAAEKEIYGTYNIKSRKNLPGSIKIFLGNLKIKTGLFKGNKIPKELHDFMISRLDEMDYATYNKKDNTLDVVTQGMAGDIDRSDIDSFINSIEGYLTRKENLLGKLDKKYDKYLDKPWEPGEWKQ